MDIRNHPPKQQTCLKHNEPVVMSNSDEKISACCLICLQNLTGRTLAEQIVNQQQQIYDKAKQKIDNNHQLLKSFHDCLLVYKENVISSLEKIKQLILDQIVTVYQWQSRFDLIFKSDRNQQKLIEELEQICNNQEQFNQDAKDQLNKQLLCFQSKFLDIGELLAILGKSEVQKNEFTTQMKKQQSTIQEVKIEGQRMAKRFQYELIKESTLKQENYCCAFAFNKDNSILVVAREKEIIIYLFINGQISKKMQRLDHTKQVLCLYYMKNQNSFVSGCNNNSIIIWVLDQNKKCIAQQVLKEHKDSVRCVMMNKNEVQIISGSDDKTIKIWIKMSEGWACSQSIDTKYCVNNMSLNEVGDKLIACQNYGTSSSIQILAQQNNQQWSIVQTLDFSGYVQRLCFTIGNQFVMQNRILHSLEIYDYDANQKQFKTVSKVKMQQIQTCEDLFSCQFIKSLNVLTFKHGKYLNIFKVNENYNYELIQTIEYGHHDLYDRMTDEGQYLVTWDKLTKEIQIRQIKYLE